MINVDASDNNIIYVKKIIFGILLHVVVKIENLASIIDNSVITCDEIIDAEAKSNNEETKSFFFNEKKYNL